MGCCNSKVFVVDETVPGQNSEAVKAFKLLELTDDDIEKFYIAFKKFDVVNNEMVEINEFLPRLDLGIPSGRVVCEVFYVNYPSFFLKRKIVLRRKYLQISTVTMMVGLILESLC